MEGKFDAHNVTIPAEHTRTSLFCTSNFCKKQIYTSCTTILLYNNIFVGLLIHSQHVLLNLLTLALLL